MPHDDPRSGKQSQDQQGRAHGDGEHRRKLSSARRPQANPVACWNGTMVTRRAR